MLSIIFFFWPKKRIERIKRMSAMSWKEWAYKEFLRYMYIFACIFVNLSILDLVLRTHKEVKILVGVVVLVVLIIFEYKLYRRLWKKG